MASKKPPAKKPAPKKPRVTVDASKTAVTVARKVGRPSKYKPEYVELAYKFCLLGATDKKLAEMFEVSEDTIHEWKSVYPEFSESICGGREIADADIAKSLYQRAKGYSHAEDDIRTVSVGGGRSDIVITPTTKHYPPDTAAASLWLRNRQPKLWRDKVEIEHGGTLKLENLPDDVLKERMAELLARLQK